MDPFRHWKTYRNKIFFKFVRNRSNVKRILIVRNGLIGDVVFITAALERLRNTFSNAVIDVVVSERAHELLIRYPSIGTIHTLKSDTTIVDQIRLFYSLRKNRYDVAVIMEMNTHYSIMSLLIRAAYVVTFRNSWDFVANVSVPWRFGEHAVVAELEVVKEWTEVPNEKVGDRLFLSVSQEELNNATALLAQSDIHKGDFLVSFHIGCSEPNSVRQWIGSRYAELANTLTQQYNAKILFTGIEKDIEEVESIRRLMSNRSANLVGKTSLRMLMALLKRSQLVIGPDTGALHIAAALHVPVVMLMGFADPADTRPFDDRRSRVVRVNLPCSPCVSKNPKPSQWKICERTRPVLCMQTLLTEDVLAAVHELIEARIISI